MTRPDPRRGLVLVTVLWSIALLSALAMAASVTFRGFAGVAAVSRDRVQGEALLTAGLEIAAEMVAAAGNNPLTGRETSVSLSTGAVRAVVSDEGGRIDVGKAPVELLAGLLHSVGATEAEAKGTAQRVVEWRDRGDGGPSDAVTRLRNQALKKQGLLQPFADVLEVAQVPGMKPQWVAALAPLATVYGNETVNPLTAPASVIAALPGVDKGRLDAFLAARRSTPTDATRIGSVLGPAQRFLQTKPQRVASVELTAMVTDGYAAAARAVIVLLPQDSQPYRVLVWKPLPSSMFR